ncbi:MAG TPA: hypothetical protein VFR80_14620 [Pyrinomonadaceae bacterium]|nr:hypothetical protein [Pyrinomonadaceae bacterium]
MKRHSLTLIAIIILAGAFTVSAQAQTTGAQKVVANIPFAFNVGNTSLPAGKYTITVLNPSSDRKVLQVRSTNGKSTAITQTTNVIGDISDDSKLVFHRYGDRYFFAKAQMAGETTGLAAPKSSAERAQKNAAAVAGTKTVVVIIAG